MSSDTDRPIFACRCLNIILFDRKEIEKESEPHPNASTEYQRLYVGDDGVKIVHNELTLRTRSGVLTDSTSGTGRTQQTVVTCLVCDTAAYRVKTDVPPDTEAKDGPIIPTEDWAERDTLLSKGGYVEVNVGKRGCLSGDQIKQLASSSSYSCYFSLALPSESHHLSNAAPFTFPQSKLAIPTSHSFLPSLPSFLPPPPFIPSHPIFMHLSSVVTESSNGARRDAEKRIEDFAKQELARVDEHESNLRKQLEHLWKIVREGLVKAERERDEKLFSSLQSRRRSMSPRRGLPAFDVAGSQVVRDFAPSTFHAPRPTNSAGGRHSALSASLATSSFHHPHARQESNAGHSKSTGATHHATLTPSPPPYTSDPSSSNSSGSVTSSIADLSRSLKRNMDASNDVAVTYRWYVIEEQEAARRKAREKMEREKGNKDKTLGKHVQRSTNKAAGSDGGRCASPQPTSRTTDEKKISSIDDKNDSPRKKDGRRKVTFNVEPNVVTIKRDIEAEANGERVLENGEDLLFDMDTDEIGGRKEGDPVEGNKTETQPDSDVQDALAREERLSRRPIVKDVSLPQSFAALRPSSLPAPSHIRPPIRTHSGENDEKSSLATSTASKDPSSSKPKDIRRESAPTSLPEEVLSPEQEDFLKRVAADTPSHRGLWRQGSDAWKIFDRNPRRSSSDNEEEEEPPQEGNANGLHAEITDWRHYKSSDIVGSVPIPMAHIHPQKPGGLVSLQPRTSLTDRLGVLVPPLPTVAEENENGKERPPAQARREAYAERNKKRGLDPGILDFAGEEDDDDDLESMEQDDDANQVSQSRSRQHALKIIKARNAVPDEGLWRSLA